MLHAICYMNMPKPSFFQKLTGVEKNDEETNEVVELEMKKEAPRTEEKVESLSKEEVMPKEKIINKKSEDREWVPESEGQLTIDVYQTPSDIIIKSTIAGVDPEEIDVSISNDMVTIKGYREKDEEIRAEDYYYQECYWGAFSRSVILPVDIEADKAEAGIKNGILTIKLPKVEKIKTRKL